MKEQKDCSKGRDKKVSLPKSCKKQFAILDRQTYEQLCFCPAIRVGDVEFKFKFTEQMPALAYEEFEQLFFDIAWRGILVSIIIDENNNVVDGKHRLIVAHILSLKNIPFDVRPCLDDEEKADMARDINLHRRHLAPAQIQEWSVKLRQEGKSYRQIGDALHVSHETARNAVAEATVNNLTLELPTSVVGNDGKKRSATAERKDSITIFAKSIAEVKDAVEACIKAGPENLPNKAIDLKRLERIARQSHKEQLRQQEYKDVSTQAATLLLGDFRIRGQEIETESVDMLLTDPPYAKEYLSLWNDLGQLAQRVLKPGGILLSYSGTYYLPQIYQMLESHLEYLWTFAIYHTNGNNFIASRNINQAWKPILAYVKPPLDKHWTSMTDMFSGGKEKEHHDWQQSVEEAKHYLKAFCKPGAVVLDAMMGSGTSIVAAVELGYKAIGIEIDSAAFATAQERVSGICKVN